VPRVGTFLFVRKRIFLESRSQVDQCTIFLGLKKNFLESPGRRSCVGLFSFLKKAVISRTHCCCRAALGGDFFFIFVWRRIFCKARVLGHASVCFLLKKYAVINQWNALLLSCCAGWGPFFVRKRFFWKAGPKRFNPKFFLRRIFWKARVAWSFFF